jgi:hypothetical protein
MELNEEEKRWGDEFMSHYFTGSRNQGEYKLLDSPGYRESIIIRNLPAGLKLRHLSEGEKTEAVCLDAVRDRASALEYVPEALMTEAVCLAAVQKDPSALQYVPDALRNEAFEAMIRTGISSGSGGSGYGIELIKPI